MASKSDSMALPIRFREGSPIFGRKSRQPLGTPRRQPLARGSPIRLSELGEKVSERINAKALAEGLVIAMVDRVEGESPYDIQEACFAYVKEEWPVPEETDRLIRDCAFENGIDRDQVMNVVAVELRDLLLPPNGDS